MNTLQAHEFNTLQFLDTIQETTTFLAKHCLLVSQRRITTNANALDHRHAQSGHPFVA